MEDAEGTVIQTVNMNSMLYRENVFAFAITAALTLVFVVIVFLSGGSTIATALFPLLVVFVVVIANFELALAALVIMLFVDYHVSWFSSAVAFSIVFGLSFLLRQKQIEWREFSNPMTVPILIYGACIMPSFVNATMPLLSILMLFNVVAFLIVFYALVAVVKTHDDLRKLVVVYLGVALVNALHVFIQSLSVQSRVFGFSGIMFVDYSALAVCVTVAMSVVSHGKRRLLLLLLACVFATALILTQTRNAWLSAVITLAILVLYLIFHPEVVGIPRKRIVRMVLVGTLVFSVVVGLIITMNPQVEKRGAELTTAEALQVSRPGEVKNSLVSRLFIWDTALNAFLAHPIAGIGVYGFPHASAQYSTIPKSLYKSYVAGVSPHQTHLAILTETGIVGAIGFSVFVFTMLRTAFRAIKLARDERGRIFAFIGAIAVSYCTVSMMFTDAWLWGQGIILLAIINGLVVANLKIDTMQTQLR